MRLWLRWLGLGVVCVAAVVASFSTLAALAEFTGWGSRASWLLPLSLDALGMTACLVWLDPTAPAKARRYAAWMTWIAAALSVLGNGAGHLASTGHLQQGLLLVVLVGSVPPAALAVTVHLIVSVSSRDVVPAQRIFPGPAKPKTEPKPKPKPEPEKKPAPKPKVEPVKDEVGLQAARHADREYRARNGGKPITRDGLKAALGCGTGKATELLAELKKERAA